MPPIIMANISVSSKKKGKSMNNIRLVAWEGVRNSNFCSSLSVIYNVLCQLGYPLQSEGVAR